MEPRSFVRFNRDYSCVKQDTIGIINSYNHNNFLEIITEDNHQISAPEEVLEEIDKDMEFQEAIEYLKKYMGHHCNDCEIQFDIRIYPNLSDKIIDDVPDSVYWKEVEDQLNGFMGNKEYDCGMITFFPWIKDWYTAGRSGGSLVITLPICIDENEIDNVEKDEYDEYVQNIIQLAKEIPFFEILLNKAKKNTEEYLALDECWEEIFNSQNQNYEEDYYNPSYDEDYYTPEDDDTFWNDFLNI